MTIFADTFVEAGAAVSLPSHTPTGANAGTGWALQIVGGAAQVAGSGANTVLDNSPSNGNRFYMNNSLGSDTHSVQALVIGGVVGGGVAVATGVCGRLPGSVGSTGIEFYYDWNDQKFHLSANGVDTQSSVVSWPSGNKTLLLECRASDFRGYVDGALTCQYTAADDKAGNLYAGIILLNFGGGSSGLARLTNYTSAPLAGGGGSAPTITSLTFDNGYQNSTQPLGIVGTNLTAGVVTFSGSGVTAANTVVNSSTSISVDAVITGAAAATLRTLTVTTGAGTATASFTVRDRTATGGALFSRVQLGM